MSTPTFGAILKLYRERGASSQGAPWPLSQARFGERVELELGLASGTYRFQVVSKWELDQKVIPAAERDLLSAIVRVLVLERRIRVPEEADRLLNAGGYQSLTPEEILRVFAGEGIASATLTEPAPAALTSPSSAPPSSGSTSNPALTAPLSRPSTRLAWLALGLAVLGISSLVTSSLGVVAAWRPLILSLGALSSGAALLIAWHGRGSSAPAPSGVVQLVASTCGDRPLSLGHQRLLVTAAFGAYFADLLEREPLYIDLDGQIDLALTGPMTGLAPLQQLIWGLSDARGPRVIVLAGEGGLGKSTLAAKLVRCLFERGAVDLILGDSAKPAVVDPVTGAINPLDPAFYTTAEFSARLEAQLGLPPSSPGQSHRLEQIRDRISGRRAVIVVDNLETVSVSGDLIRDLRRLVSRDVRVIVTTRTLAGLIRASDVGLVQLRGLATLTVLRAFMRWHIQAYAPGHPALLRLEPDLAHTGRLQRLLTRTGGSPLLIQLVVSDVARLGWSRLDHLPDLYGRALLGYLYDDRWQELELAGEPGRCARKVLAFVTAEQERGQAVTLERVTAWVAQHGLSADLAPAVQLLQERFLLVPREAEQGRLSLLPSLAQFVQARADEL